MSEHFAAAKWINYAQYHTVLLKRWSKWFINIQHDTKSHIITADIDTTSDTHGTSLLQQPFHCLSSVDAYAFPILYTISDLIFSKKTNPFKNYTFHEGISDSYKKGTKTPGSAAIGEHIQYNKLCATHPTFLVLQYTFHNIKGRTTADFDFYFMSKQFRSDKYDPFQLRCECIAYLQHQWAFIEIDKYTEKVQSKRIRDPPSQIAMDSFVFVDPHFVGKSNPNEVFLGPLLVKNEDNGVNSRYYAEGILNHETAFDLHPFIDGSGDHLNATLLSDIVYQFGNLVARNGKNAQSEYMVLKEFFSRIDYFNDKWTMAVVDAEVSFVKYMELNAFTMVLEEVNYVKENDERIRKLHFRPRFAFEMTVSLNQFGYQRSVVKALIVPLYQIANL